MVYAAHYSDCEHEVTPLTSGYRLALIYSLVWTGETQRPSLDSNARNEKVLESLLKQHETNKKGIFGWDLEHMYSEEALKKGVAALKGTDRFVGQALHNANGNLEEKLKFTFYVAEIERTIDEYDTGGCGGYYGRRRRRYDSDSDGSFDGKSTDFIALLGGRGSLAR